MAELLDVRIKAKETAVYLLKKRQWLSYQVSRLLSKKLKVVLMSDGYSKPG
jgi:hypothetical protein